LENQVIGEIIRRIFAMKERMRSFVNKGNQIMQNVPEDASERIKHKATKSAIREVENGLKHYSGKVIDAISPYAMADAGLVVIVLRHLADEVERNNPGAKEFYDGMKDNLVCPALDETTRVKKPSSR